MSRPRRRSPVSHRADPAEHGSRDQVLQQYGWPADVDPRRLDDPAYRRDVIEPHRARTGWMPPGDPSIPRTEEP